MNTVSQNLLTLALSILLAAPLSAAAVSDDVSVNLTQLQDGSIEVDGQFTTQAKAAVVWQQLSNYDGLSQLVSSMKESRVVERDDDAILVRQRALGQFLFFSRTLYLTLKVRETPFREISFEDISGESFFRYQGSWTIESAGEDLLKVHYRLTTLQKEKVPGFVLRHVASSLAEDLLREVHTGILKAAEGAAVAARPTP